MNTLRCPLTNAPCYPCTVKVEREISRELSLIPPVLCEEAGRLARVLAEEHGTGTLTCQELCDRVVEDAVTIAQERFT